MPYIGRELERGTYLKLDDISSSFDGSKTIFNLTKGGDPFFPGSPQSIIVSLNGTILEPVTQYGIDSSKIVFGTPPTAGHSFFSITLGLPFGVADNDNIDDTSITGVKLSSPFNYDDGLLYLNAANDRVGIRTTNPTHDLDIHGDVRVVGILTVGTSSLTLDGSNNKIQVGTALTLSHSDGAIIGNSHLHSTGYDLKDNTRIRLGDGNDFQIFHTTTGSEHNRIESGDKQLRILSSNQIQLNTGTEHMARFHADGAAELYHGMGSGAGAEKKFETSTVGATVTGKLVITGDLDVQGTTTTLDTVLTEVDKLEVGANNTTVGVAITQSGTGDILNLYDGSSEVFTVTDGGLVGVNCTPTALPLEVKQKSANGGSLRLRDSSATYRYLEFDVTGALTQITARSNNSHGSINIGTIDQFGRTTQLYIKGGANAKVGIATDSPKTLLNVYNGTPSDTGGILVSNVSYAANQDKPYLIIGTKDWTGAATNWNTFGFQHKIKVNSGGVPRLTIDTANGGTEVELFSFKNGGSLGIGVTEPTGKLHLPDSGELLLGNDGDLKILHTGSLGVIGNVTGDLYIQANQNGDVGGDIYIRAKAGEDSIKVEDDGAVYLYSDNEPKFRTYSEGIQVLSSEGGNASILLKADEGDDNNDQYRLIAGNGTSLYLQNYATGGWVSNLIATGNGSVDIRHAGEERFVTDADGITIKNNGGIPQVAIAQTTSTAYSVNGTVAFVNSTGTTCQINGRTGSGSTAGDMLFLVNSDGREGLAILEDGRVRVPDGGKFVAGTGNDLEIFHNTSGGSEYNEIQSNNGNIRIRNYDTSGPGKSIYLQSEIIQLRTHTNNHTMVDARAGAQVDLYHNNVLRLSTTNTGVGISSNLSVSGISTFTGSVQMNGQLVLPTTGEGIKFGPGNSANDNAHIEWKDNGSNEGYLRISTADDSDNSNTNEYIEFGDYAQTNKVGTFTQHLRIARDQFLVRTGSNSISQADRLKIDSSGTVNIYNDLDVDGATTLDGLTVSEAATFSADVNVGDGSAQSRILIKKADNNLSDHIQFFNGTTKVGEIGCGDTTWLRINQGVAKNIYTPRYIRADGGFFVDDTTKGINGSGNFIGGTIAGASDYNTLLRSDTGDTMNGNLTVGGSSVSANEGGEVRLTLAPNSTLSGSTITIDQYIDKLRFFEGSGGTARGATIDFTRITGATDNEIFSSGLTGVGFTVTHLRSFGIPNGVVAISTSTQSHTPLTVTNSGGANASTIITKFVGDSDALEIRNITGGDYMIRNSNQNNGITFFDGGSGMAFLYNNNRKMSVLDIGVKLNDELTFENDDEGVTTHGGGRFYKKNGGGMVIRQSSGNQTPIIEANNGTLQGTILHTGSTVEVTGNMKFSGDGLQMSDHYFHGYYDTTNRRHYIHLYPAASSDRGTGASQTDIRAWTGSTFRTLVIKGDADPTWDGNTILHTGNINTVDLDNATVGTALTANKVALGNDSSGSTPRRLVFASADTGDVTIQADTSSGATYTPSTGTISAQVLSGTLNASNLTGTISDARISDIGDSQARIITFDNLEKGNFNADGQLGYDSSQGLLLYRTQQGTTGTVSVLDGANVDAGTGISITNLGTGGTGTESFTFSLANHSADLLTSGTLDDARIPDIITPGTRVQTDEVRCNSGQQLVLNVGESSSAITSGQTAEYLYVNAEQGISVNTPSSANANWQGGTAFDTTIIKGTQITIDGNRVWDAGGSGNEAQSILLNGATNFDSYKKSGFYSLYNVNASGHTNAPFQYGAMITAGNTASGLGMAMQIAHERLGNGTFIRGMNDTGDTWHSWQEIWTSGTDGSGSGLDADKLDGVEGSSYLRSDANDTMSGRITLTSSDAYPLTINSTNNAKIVLAGSTQPYIRFRESSTDKAYIQWTTAGYLQFVNEETGEYFRIGNGTDGLEFVEGGNVRTVIHSGNAQSQLTETFVRKNASSTIDGNLTFAASHYIQMHNTATKDKYRVWNSSAYAIGMDNGLTYGGLNDYAMTFMMSNTADRGWLFLDAGHTDAQGAMSLTTNGRLTVADSMRLGFGQSDTTAPDSSVATLDINGTLTLKDHIKFGPGGTTNDDAHIEWLGNNNAGYLRISTSDDSDSTGTNEYIEFGDYAAVDRGGSFVQHLKMHRGLFLVRTGSSTIAQEDRLRIDVNGNCGLNATPRTTGSIFNNTDHFLCIGDSDTGLAQDGDGVLEIWANNVEVANITSTVFQIKKETRIPNGSASDPSINFHNDQNTGIFRDGSTGDTFCIATGGGEGFRMDGNNRVVIGNDPSSNDRNAQLYVKTTDTARKGLTVQSMGSGTDMLDVWSNRTGDGDGSDDDDVHLVAFRIGSGTALRGSIFYDESDGQVDYNRTSDRRLKENIVDIDNAIDVVKQLKPRKFNFNKGFYNNNDIKYGKANTIAGFIADEVETLIPQAVTGTKDAVHTEDKPEDDAKKGDIIAQQLDVSQLIPHLTKALQEAVAKIETLEAEVAALKAKVG